MRLIFLLKVIDACAALGNKTVHIAALMKGQGKVVACELNKDRVKRLEQTTKLAGATSILIYACASYVEVLHENFLNLDPEDQLYYKLMLASMKFVLQIKENLSLFQQLQVRAKRKIVQVTGKTSYAQARDKLKISALATFPPAHMVTTVIKKWPDKELFPLSYICSSILNPENAAEGLIRSLDSYEVVGSEEIVPNWFEEHVQVAIKKVVRADDA
ncbi:probable 28S rRNA (cytosine-C(5))-methyltransferase [Tanacetum coccineum]